MILNKTNKKTLVIFFIVILLAGALVFFNNPKIIGYALLNENDKLIVSLDIPPDQQKINPGQSILLEVAIREIGGTIGEATPIDLEYAIKDLNGNIISSKQESGSIAVKQSEVTSLLIPTNTKPGVYTASVSVNYQGNIYNGTKTFEVFGSGKKLITDNYYIIIVLGVLILIVSSFLIISRFNRKVKGISKTYARELDSVKKKIRKGKIKSSEAIEISDRFTSQLSLLEKAYEKGYISKKSYEKGKEKINKVHKSLRRKYL